MTDVEELFLNKKADAKKLLAFGFLKNKGDYSFSTKLLGGQFTMNVVFSKNGKIVADVIDSLTNEIYAPLKIYGAKGAFVKSVRTEYEKVLNKILKECFSTGAYRSEYAEKVIAYIKKKYDDSPEFLWERTPKNGIFRRKDNAKWYAALLNLPKYKFGLDGDELVDIIDLRIKTSDIENIVDGKKYFPGYHMNKNHWFTICLDGSVSLKEIYRFIDSSYKLALK